MPSVHTVHPPPPSKSDRQQCTVTDHFARKVWYGLYSHPLHELWSQSWLLNKQLQIIYSLSVCTNSHVDNARLAPEGSKVSHMLEPPNWQRAHHLNSTTTLTLQWASEKVRENMWKLPLPNLRGTAHSSFSQDRKTPGASTVPLQHAKEAYTGRHPKSGLFQNQDIFVQDFFL